MTLSAVTNANPRIDNRSVSPSPESPNLQNVTPRREAASSHAFEILHKDAGAKEAYNP